MLEKYFRNDRGIMMAKIYIALSAICLVTVHSCREEYCSCDSVTYKMSCTRLNDPIDAVLPTMVPSKTKILQMNKVWVDNAVQLGPDNFLGLRNLVTVDFSHNRISAVLSGTFR